MSHSQIVFFSSALVFLILLAAFFSAAETGLMAINRYRLRHHARLKKNYAILILDLLKRPDRLLGMILIGSNFCTILASSLATLIVIEIWGEKGVILSTIVLTLLILVFAEVAPKTLAAVYPERVSRLIAWPVLILLKILYPIVWFINALSNTFLRILGVNIKAHKLEPLSQEELHTLVYETSSRFSQHYQKMLLAILDLNKMTVDDVMIPRAQIVGIDLEKPWNKVQKQIAESSYDWLPVYREQINNLAGILHLRDLSRLLFSDEKVEKEVLERVLQQPYFVPEGTPLNIQLGNFQRQRKRWALVVDEYGEIQGIVTLEDILEEIVGEFTTNVQGLNVIQPQPDGSYIVDGATMVRELNRTLHFELPTKGPRTLNGLITEYLESIPREGIGLRIANYPIEILHVKKNRVKTARIFPRLT